MTETAIHEPVKAAINADPVNTLTEVRQVEPKRAPRAEATKSTCAAAQTNEMNGATGSFQMMALEKLRPHPLLAEIYGDFIGEEDGLMESVRAEGIKYPLIATPDGIVLAGGERLRVARLLGIEELPVIVKDLTDPLEIAAEILASNVYRLKTAEQKVREYREFKRIEAQKAATRKGARTDLLVNSPGGENGASRDLAAAKVGWGGSTAEKGAKVLGAIEKAQAEDENMQDVEELRTTLNNRSVEAAYQRALEFGWIQNGAVGKKGKGATPGQRMAAAFRRATTAAAKLSEIIAEDDVANLNPAQKRELKAALMPVLKWVDGLEVI